MLSLNFCKGGRWMKMKMERRNTDDLRSELMDAPDLTTFLAANEDNFSSASAVARLNEMLEKKGLSKAALAKQSGMSEIYLHQIFAGRRNPSRSRMLCLCFCACAASPSSIPRSGATRSSFTGCCMAWTFSPSTTGCSPRTRKRCSDTYTLKSDTTRQKAPALKAGAFLLFSSARRFLRALQCAPQRREEHEDKDRI